MKITVATTVNAPIAKVWQAYTDPSHVTQWNAASDEWHCPRATSELREGGPFCYRMEAKDGSIGFDFAGAFTEIVEHKSIAYAFGDRTARVDFIPVGGGVEVRVAFDAETTFPVEKQRDGWQAILNNFARHAVSL